MPGSYNAYDASRGAPSQEGAPALRRSLRDDDRGSVAIEFAFVGAVFLVILFGIVSYGFQFATRIALSYAVTEGGRAAVGGLDSAQRQLYATNAINNTLNAYSPFVEGTSANGDTLKIGIDYTDTRFTLLPFISAPDETMRVETIFVVTDPSG